jgi:hypothetical protein
MLFFIILSQVIKIIEEEILIGDTSTIGGS